MEWERPRRHDRHLTLLITAALAAPLAAAAFGRRLATPFGLEGWELGVLLAGVVVVHAGIALVSTRPDRVIAEILAALLLAVPFAYLIRTRANGFYTTTALLEGLAVLLVLNLLARLLHRFAVIPHFGTTAPRSATLAAADFLVELALLFAVGIFPFALAGVHEAAGACLLIAAAVHLPAILLRLPNGVRGITTALRGSPRELRVRYHVARRRVRRRRRARRTRRQLASSV